MAPGRRGVGKWLVVVLVAIGAATGYVLSGLAPNYRSEARMLVVSQRIPGDIVGMPAPESVEGRLAALQDSILTRSRLERLIVEFNLYASERRKGAIMQDLVDLAAKDISVTVDTPRFGGEATVIVVSYTAKEPRTAQRVTEQLATFFLTESLKQGERTAESTSNFVESLLADAGRRLAEHDEKMAAARVAGGRDFGQMQMEAEVLRNNYKALLEKREQALMRVNMERSGNGDQFRLIEPVRIPERPVGPTRPAASVAGGLAGLALALVVNLFIWIRRVLTSRAADKIPVVTA